MLLKTTSKLKQHYVQQMLTKFNKVFKRHKVQATLELSPSKILPTLREELQRFFSQNIKTFSHKSINGFYL